MLISSMDQLNYYSMANDNYLEIDTSEQETYGMGQQAMLDDGSPAYLNEENSPKNGTKSSLYKTELCKRFSEFGSCRYGAKCQFAHGLAELRHVVRHPKYKTTKCKSYWGSGHCPYGSRCRFIHEEAESMTPPPQFSPPGSMSGMFMHDNIVATGAVELGVSPHTAGGGYLYGGPTGAGMASNGDHHHFRMLPGFDHGGSTVAGVNGTSPAAVAWGVGHHGVAPKLSYGGDSFASVQASSRLPPPPPTGVDLHGGSVAVNGGRGGGATSATGGAGPSYPDLQDAIDALMKFSISPAEMEAAAAGGALGTISSTPHESALGGNGGGNAATNVGNAVATSSPIGASAGGVSAGDHQTVRSQKTDYSLHADELWKDFPSLSSSSSVDFSDKQWPAGLSLSLEGSGLFHSGTSTSTSSTSKVTTGSTSASSSTETSGTGMGTGNSSPAAEADNAHQEAGKKGDESSPRLSVFERFH